MWTASRLALFDARTKTISADTRTAHLSAERKRELENTRRILQEQNGA
jgi:hypothetical protein